MQVPSESFSVLIEESDGALHLYLAGWLDASAVPALLRSVTRGRPGDVVLDIDGLDHIDGAGWLGVISCEQRVTRWGGRLRIDHGIRKILELAPSTS
jgi:anti-anti-sigma regulatory factor